MTTHTRDKVMTITLVQRNHIAAVFQACAHFNHKPDLYTKGSLFETMLDSMRTMHTSPLEYGMQFAKACGDTVSIDDSVIGGCNFSTPDADFGIVGAFGMGWIVTIRKWESPHMVYDYLSPLLTLVDPATQVVQWPMENMDRLGAKPLREVLEICKPTK